MATKLRALIWLALALARILTPAPSGPVHQIDHAIAPPGRLSPRHRDDPRRAQPQPPHPA